MADIPELHNGSSLFLFHKTKCLRAILHYLSDRRREMAVFDFHSARCVVIFLCLSLLKGANG